MDDFPERQVLGGAPFNVARHLRAFGLNPILITRIGGDAAGEALLAAMEWFRMDTRGVQRDPLRPTGQVMVQREKGGHRFEILPDQAYDYIHAGVARLVALSIQPRMFYFGTLAQRHAVSRRALNLLLQSAAALKVLDINLRSPWYELATLRRSMQQADILKVNDEELRLIATLFRLSGKDDANHAEQLLKRFSLQQIVVTCGSKGAWLLDAEGKKIDAIRVPDDELATVDTVGAGDGFAAVFMLGMLAHWPIPLALSRANDFARAVCEIPGAIPERDDFYMPFVRDWNLVRVQS